MFRLTRFISGIWVGAGLVAWLAACALVYLLTGKVFVPGKKSTRLLDVYDVTVQLRSTILNMLEKIHG